MTSTTETGHAKNVDNAELLNTTIATFGTKYNPGNPAIALTALQAKVTAGHKAVNEVSLAQANVFQAAAARDEAFKGLLPISTSIVNTLKASTTSEKIDANATTIIRKLRGSRAKPLPKPKPAAEGEAAVKVETVSVSHKSFDSQVDSLDELVNLLATTPEYTPNEPELKLDAVKAFSASLRAKNNAVNAANAALIAARTTRNRELYEPDKGLVDLCLNAKLYVKALFGQSGPEYKSVAKIELRDIKP
jgi:hypothetical protein